MTSSLGRSLGLSGAWVALGLVACQHAEPARAAAPQDAPPPPASPPAPAASPTAESAPSHPGDEAVLTLSCSDAGPSERMPFAGKPGRDWRITAFWSAQPTELSAYETDGREPIHQRVTRELFGFVPLDPQARLTTWKLILDPPVGDRERTSFLLPDRAPQATPIVNSQQAWASGVLLADAALGSCDLTGMPNRLQGREVHRTRGRVCTPRAACTPASSTSQHSSAGTLAR
jgi:hypothetical protein